MSSSPSSSSSSASALPPPLAVDNDPESAESARQRLKPASRFPMSLSMPNLRKPRAVKSKLRRGRDEDDTPQYSPSALTRDDENETASIELGESAEGPNEEKQDRYEWAILYENQRGITLFSTPYYSSNSLLPSDPPPFTVPNASQKRNHQPNVSLTEYPLPDGNWRWVSKTWMIDMRSDSGEVQHDGFEYNWVFRRHHWRAQIGSLSAGGFVRRRRWVRLMMRPGRGTKEHEDGEGIIPEAESPILDGLIVPNTPLYSSSGPGTSARRHSVTISLAATAASTASPGMSPAIRGIVERWGGEPESDWKMCRYFLRLAGRDGLKLDLWKKWLGLEKSKERTDDGGEAPQSAPPLPYVIAVLQAEAPEILESFVFPESRARFFELLDQANVLSDLKKGLDHDFTSDLSFWSLSSDVKLKSDTSLGDIDRAQTDGRSISGSLRAKDDV
ncbi:hypothetical protein VNI00_001593 [Paramarasmius palmivorus]|uniref:TECPR1-like DysF domain-containing protein n=1 Tax=Paramarasmius palmivorus TaxID=297713 RepID=A0AAW0E4J9_9AGAR